MPAGEPVLYGQKVCVEFSDQLATPGVLASMRAGRTCLGTQLIAKQEVYMQALEDEVEERRLLESLRQVLRARDDDA